MQMKKTMIVLLIFCFVVIFACSLNVWLQTSPWVDDYKVLHKRDTENHLVRAFATALRINHSAAYDMIDPMLKPRLDEWMRTHSSRKCTVIEDYFNVGYGTKEGYRVSFGCAIENSLWYSYEVDNIVIKDMKVIDWGEVIEK